MPPGRLSLLRGPQSSRALLAALRAQLEAVALEGQVQAWSSEQRELVFPNKAGRIMRGRVAAVLAKAGLPYRKYHSTRYTFATWLLSDAAAAGPARGGR